MIIYGKNVIKEAVLSKRPLYRVYLDEKFGDNKFIEFLKKNHVTYEKTTKGHLNNITQQAIHQGIAAEAKPYVYQELTDILNPDKVQRFLILDEIQDPHNLGAILRSAEATKVDGVIVSKKHQVPLTGVVAKTSSGAIEHVNMIEVSNLYQTMLTLQKNNVYIIGTASEATIDYRAIKHSGSLAIVVGNEGQGMRELVKRGCNQLVSIPMFGKVNSLNVSVAAALLLYATIN